MRGRKLIVRGLLGLIAACGLLGLGASPAAAIAANGSFIQVTGNAAIYEVIGGAAVYLDTCSGYSLDCTKPTKVSSLSGYASVPANGSFIQIQNDGGYIGEFIGGSIVHVDSCAILSCTGTLPIDNGSANLYASAHPTPTPGTFIKSVGPGNAGYIGEVIGGAVIHVDSCATLSCSPQVNLDAGGLADYMAAHPVPVDGTLIRAIDGPNAGFVGEVIGGAVIHLDSCADFNGCAGNENLDSGGLSDYMNAHPLPANGTFVQIADGPQKGLIARVAGGAFLVIGDCSSIGGCPSTIDQLDSGGFNDWSSAHTLPVDGTYLLGEPSNTTWEMLGGQRQQVAANSAAVPVDDSSLNAIPVAAPTTSSSGSGSGSGQPVSVTPPTHTRVCTRETGRGKHRHKVRVKCPVHKVAIQFALNFRFNRASSQLLSISSAKLRRPYRVTLACSGAGCPFSSKNWTRGTAGAYLKSLSGVIFHAGDRLLFTISHDGETSERIMVLIRYAHLPVGRVTT